MSPDAIGIAANPYPHLSTNTARANSELRSFRRRRKIPGVFKVGDRDYFMLRAREERNAAAHSMGAVRGRHEELAWLYEMRIMYIDRGLVGDDAETPGPEQGPPIQHIIVHA